MSAQDTGLYMISEAACPASVNSLISRGKLLFFGPDGTQDACLRPGVDWFGLAGIGLRGAKNAKSWGRENVQKKFKKLLTGTGLFAILSAHTVNT